MTKESTKELELFLEECVGEMSSVQTVRMFLNLNVSGSTAENVLLLKVTDSVSYPASLILC